MPAEQRQEVHDRLGQVAGLAQLLHAGRAVALREALAIGAEEQRQVGEGRHRPAERLVHEHLARRRAEQVLAADHVRDPHVGVVDRVGEVVGRDAVGAQDHVIAELRVLEAHRAAHEILDDARALVGNAQADDRGGARGLARAVAPRR